MRGTLVAAGMEIFSCSLMALSTAFIHSFIPLIAAFYNQGIMLGPEDRERLGHLVLESVIVI